MFYFSKIERGKKREAGKKAGNVKQFERGDQVESWKS